MIVAGLISGTSLDAIDLAVGEFSWRGDIIHLRPLHHAEHPWPPATRERLLAALPPAATTMAEVCALDVLVGEAFAAAAGHARGAELIASHGQNVFHWTEAGQARGSLQLGQPAAIVEATGLPVISDFRARDVAAGGQGAPLASTLDALWLAGPETRVALNLGGIANVTVIRPGQPVLAFDTGPASCLLDMEAVRITGGRQAADLDGRIARAGQVRGDLLARLLADPYYARAAPKSTGREQFDRCYVGRHLAGLPAVGDADLMATLVELTATTVAGACARYGASEIVASGGGVRNPALMDALRRLAAPARVGTTDGFGLPADAKEAYLFALLGFLTWHGVPGTVTGATGSATARVLGRISPGNAPLRLPIARGAASGLVIVQDRTL